MISKETEDRLFAFARTATPEALRRMVDRDHEETMERLRNHVAELRDESAEQPPDRAAS